MRMLMIGLGSIARKAYLPVLGTRADLELHLVTRDPEPLAALGSAYRAAGCHKDLDEALNSGPFDAAFVHAATSAHSMIVERLLREKIAVFVDKPLADRHDEAVRLVRVAEAAGVSLTVGLNRRYAPDVMALRGVPHDTLLMSKHRRQPAGAPRETVFDDFIHVVDTLRFLSPASDPKIGIQTTVRDGQLLSVMLLLSSPGYKAIGLMNRNAGSDEERIEIIGGGGRTAVANLSETIAYDGAEIRTRRGDWTPVSMQRGFDGMCADFLDAVREHRPPAAHDILETHRICELIVQHAEAGGR